MSLELTEPGAERPALRVIEGRALPAPTGEEPAGAGGSARIQPLPILSITRLGARAGERSQLLDPPEHAKHNRARRPQIANEFLSMLEPRELRRNERRPVGIPI